jgi:dTDP-4-dehydrorhamnose 3,5-epimerase-like enzyme
MKLLDPYIFHQDQRGFFKGITQDIWHEINYVETEPNLTRGNHYHKETLELFYIISGEIDIDVRHVESGVQTALIAKGGDIFIIEPYELHTFHTNTKAQWINALSKAIDVDKPDIHKGP